MVKLSHFWSYTQKSFIIVLALTFVSLFSLSFTINVTPVYADQKLTCRDVTVPVKLSKTDSTEYQISGSLCSRGSLTGKTMQVLIHGITYDKNYWNFPSINNKNYSYVSRSTAAGFATFSIDRIGIGKSSHPTDSMSVNLKSNGYIVHQLVQKLRAGEIGKTPFSKIVLVGHSYGSAISLYESATYQDVDGLILTGLMHDAAPEGTAEIQGYIYPAQQDPKFASQHLPEGYLTTIPGTRGPAFHNTAMVDPDVIALDEKWKQTVTAGELNSLMDVTVLYEKIKVPVLLAVGQKDILFCNNITYLCTNSAKIQERESPYFKQAKSVQSYLLKNAGHDINLDPNAHLWFEKANEWAKTKIRK
jgi:pimeloyl-ACP methyl ester carboxylesterase